MKRTLVAIVVAATAVTSASCAKAKRPALQPSAPVPGATLWVEPTDLAQRDLFNGPWGADHAPDPNGVYTLVERKHTGVNLGLTVKDAAGREWSVKQPYPGNLDSEAPVEVVISRLLSAVGYHQPPVYHLASFKLKDDWGTRVETGGRFRLKEETLKDVGVWQWEENPFIGTPPYQGLLVMLMMFNSTDLKNSNNTLYEHKVGDLIEQWYAARDVGAALGGTQRLAPRKNSIDAFEQTPFILGVGNGHVQFAYESWFTPYVQDRITPEEVAWASRWLGQLSERQWHDAFRAGGYQPEIAARFIRKIQQKIDQGQSLSRVAVRD